MSIAAGVGGGAFFVPLFNILLQFSAALCLHLLSASIAAQLNRSLMRAQAPLAGLPGLADAAKQCMIVSWILPADIACMSEALGHS